MDNNVPVSKIKIGTDIYYLKDIEARTTLSKLKDLAYKTSASGDISVITGIDDIMYVPKGSIAIIPATTKIQYVTNAGTLPSYTAAQYTAPSVSEAKSKFAIEGITIAVDNADTEMLVFNNASKMNALTSTGFNEGSYTAASFSKGTLPTLSNQQTVVTGITSATFTGEKAIITPSVAMGIKTITVN